MCERQEGRSWRGPLGVCVSLRYKVSIILALIVLATPIKASITYLSVGPSHHSQMHKTITRPTLCTSVGTYKNFSQHASFLGCQSCHKVYFSVPNTPQYSHSHLTNPHTTLWQSTPSKNHNTHIVISITPTLPCGNPHLAKITSALTIQYTILI